VTGPVGERTAGWPAGVWRSSRDQLMLWLTLYR